jgi:hypothetical protein
MLSTEWVNWIIAGSLLEAHCSAWNTRIVMWNQLSMVWTSIATTTVSLLLNMVRVLMRDAHSGPLVLGSLAGEL